MVHFAWAERSGVGDGRVYFCRGQGIGVSDGRGRSGGALRSGVGVGRAHFDGAPVSSGSGGRASSGRAGGFKFNIRGALWVMFGRLFSCEVEF